MKHRNRLAKKNPKSGWTYCGGCDASIIYEGQKCSKCGWKYETKHGKKSDFIDLRNEKKQDGEF